MPAKRIAVFIDYQNAFRGARQAFHNGGSARHQDGHFDPMQVAKLLASRPRHAPEGVVLSEVRVYTGRPDPRKDARSYTPHMKQCDRWEKSGVIPITRQLRYPSDYPASRPEEKGIDVALAIDYVAYAIDDKFDIGIVFSTDTDLKPPLEFVRKRLGLTKSIEVAAWRSDTSRPRLSLHPVKIWCHYLWAVDYKAVADPTDYNTV